MPVRFGMGTAEVCGLWFMVQVSGVYYIPYMHMQHTANFQQGSQGARVVEAAWIVVCVALVQFQTIVMMNVAQPN